MIVTDGEFPGVTVPRHAVTGLLKAVGFEVFGSVCNGCGAISDSCYPCGECVPDVGFDILWREPEQGR